MEDSSDEISELLFRVMGGHGRCHLVVHLPPIVVIPSSGAVSPTAVFTSPPVVSVPPVVMGGGRRLSMSVVRLGVG